MEITLGAKVIVLIGHAETRCGTIVDFDESGQVTVAEKDGNEWIGDESQIDDIWETDE